MPACMSHPRAPTAGVRKAPRHEIAGCRALRVPQPISGLWGFDEHAGGRKCPADWNILARADDLSLLAGALARARQQEGRPPVWREAILSWRGASYGKRRRGRAKPSSNCEHCGLETAITAS